jgi:hypothetical protein
LHDDPPLLLANLISHSHGWIGKSFFAITHTSPLAAKITGIPEVVRGPIAAGFYRDLLELSCGKALHILPVLTENQACTRR